ncbi:MAG: threonine ammonia-lyase [Thermodesulfobacteriota bacterium]|nr:threonine ammonia-lyase [Thermodesulfobacteriota bacterium]
MVNIETIEKTRNRLAPVVFHTPLVPSPHLSRLVGAEVFLKLENLQRTGSFKIRGAYSRLYNLAAQGHEAVVAASAGNHAQGVALAARLLNLKATIIMPENVSLSKREATAAYGADVRLIGECVEDCFSAACSLEGGLTFIHPFDDEDVILGQGSLGLEILEDLPDLEAVVAPVGGGGLIAGVAAAIKAKHPQVMILGVEPSRAASAGEALKAGRPVEVHTEPTLADGTRVAKIGDLNLPLIQKYVDDVVQVDEEHIAQAMLLLLERRRIVAEGAGALALAAFLARLVPRLKGRRVVLLVSGGNVDANLIGRIIDRRLVRSGRIFKFSVVLDDHPGALAKLLDVATSTRANVLHIFHDRLGRNLPLDRSRVGLELETRGREHIMEIKSFLADRGYEISEEI